MIKDLKLMVVYWDILLGIEQAIKDYQSQTIIKKSFKEKLNQYLTDLPVETLRGLVCKLFYIVLERESKELTKVVQEIDKQTELIQAIAELQTAAKEIGQFKYFLTQTELRVDTIRINIELGRITTLKDLNNSIIEQESNLEEIINLNEYIEGQYKVVLYQLLKDLYDKIIKRGNSRIGPNFENLRKGLVEVSTVIKKVIQQID
ncbi:21555_t:CDS:2 [Cetraspora pellucida]|uniref:21555_t:CDS:1 n=1 Tax=Cetraspora pellucida TaxID=1433469 RepID=A0A9N9A1G4_9GLOM|nr:21555_t:CDS:2 [Cetraspora pellucida]